MLTPEFYREWYKQQQEMLQLAESYANRYAKKFNMVGGRGQSITFFYEFEEDCVGITFHSHRPYGATNDGWIEVSIALLLGSSEEWDAWLTNLYENDQAVKERERVFFENQRREKEIAGAKAILERYDVK